MTTSNTLKMENSLDKNYKAKHTKPVKNIISDSVNLLDELFEDINFRIIDHEEDLEEVFEDIELWDYPDILVFTQKQLLINHKNKLKNDYYCYISYDNMYFVFTKNTLNDFRTAWIKIKASYTANWLRYYKITDSWSRDKFQSFLDWLNI